MLMVLLIYIYIVFKYLHPSLCKDSIVIEYAFVQIYRLSLHQLQIVTELPAWPLHQGECVSCSLCLTVITSGRIVYNDNNYHVTCANLWLNCVNNQLPVMRYSLLYQPNICPGSHI